MTEQQQQQQEIKQSQNPFPGIEYFFRIAPLATHCAMQHSPEDESEYHTNPAPTQLPPNAHSCGRASFSTFKL
jgi:hypothetical protein